MASDCHGPTVWSTDSGDDDEEEEKVEMKMMKKKKKRTHSDPQPRTLMTGRPQQRRAPQTVHRHEGDSWRPMFVSYGMGQTGRLWDTDSNRPRAWTTEKGAETKLGAKSGRRRRTTPHTDDRAPPAAQGPAG
jgi:hypothetical protein